MWMHDIRAKIWNKLRRRSMPPPDNQFNAKWIQVVLPKYKSILSVKSKEKDEAKEQDLRQATMIEQIEEMDKRMAKLLKREKEMEQTLSSFKEDVQTQLSKITALSDSTKTTQELSEIKMHLQQILQQKRDIPVG